MLYSHIDQEHYSDHSGGVKTLWNLQKWVPRPLSMLAIWSQKKWCAGGAELQRQWYKGWDGARQNWCAAEAQQGGFRCYCWELPASRNLTFLVEPDFLILNEFKLESPRDQCAPAGQLVFRVSVCIQFLGFWKANNQIFRFNLYLFT